MRLEIAEYKQSNFYIPNFIVVLSKGRKPPKKKRELGKMHFCFELLDCGQLWTSDLTCWADTQEVTTTSQSDWWLIFHMVYNFENT